MDPRFRGDDVGVRAVPASCRLPSAFSRPKVLSVRDLGLLPYSTALELQRGLARQRITGELAHDVLLLVEHPPVVTLGRKAQRGGSSTATAEFLAARGVELFEVERGGDATFHGPGQLVGYPIMNLEQHTKDLHWYLRALEEVLIRALGWWGIEAERRDGLTGVWTQGRKIASIGVHARGWVTWHGFALNVTNDLAYFDLIVPCGIQGVVMTSVERELGESAPSLSEARSDVVRAFRDVFGFAADEDEVESAPERRTASHSRSAP
jgi:lipoyl(octanoyl) transferase